MLRWGISSAGVFLEKGVLPLLGRVENMEVTALSDEANPARMRAVAEKFGIKRTYARFTDMLQDGDIDAVYVNCPNAFHKDLAVAAARAGKHVLCEKPLGMNAAECRVILAACQAQAVKLGVNFCYPNAGPQMKAKQLIAEGAIGAVGHISTSFNLHNFTGEAAGWRRDPKVSGGGPLMDLAPHLINLACFFAEDRVRSVMAYAGPEKTDKEVESRALAALELTGGMTATVEVSFERCIPNNYTVIGMEGAIEARGTMGWQVGGDLKLTVLREDFETREVRYEPVEGIEETFRIFTRAVENDTPFFFDGAAGLHAQAVIDAIYESARTGRRCLVDGA